MEALGINCRPAVRFWNIYVNEWSKAQAAQRRRRWNLTLKAFISYALIVHISTNIKEIKCIVIINYEPNTNEYLLAWAVLVVDMPAFALSR